MSSLKPRRLASKPCLAAMGLEIRLRCLCRRGKFPNKPLTKEERQKMKIADKSKNSLKITSGVKAGTCGQPQWLVDNVAKACCKKGNKLACRQYVNAVAPRGCVSSYASCDDIKG